MPTYFNEEAPNKVPDKWHKSWSPHTLYAYISEYTWYPQWREKIFLWYTVNLTQNSLIRKQGHHASIGNDRLFNFLPNLAHKWELKTAHPLIFSTCVAFWDHKKLRSLPEKAGWERKSRAAVPFCQQKAPTIKTKPSRPVACWQQWALMTYVLKIAREFFVVWNKRGLKGKNSIFAHACRGLCH